MALLLAQAPLSSRAKLVKGVGQPTSRHEHVNWLPMLPSSGRPGAFLLQWVNVVERSIFERLKFGKYRVSPC